MIVRLSPTKIDVGAYEAQVRSESRRALSGRNFALSSVQATHDRLNKSLGVEHEVEYVRDHAGSEPAHAQRIAHGGKFSSVEAPKLSIASLGNLPCQVTVILP